MKLLKQILQRTKFSTFTKHLMRQIVRFITDIIYDEINIVRQQRLSDKTQTILNKLQSCGTGVKINGKIIITEPQSCTIGNNVHIGNNAFFSTAGGLTIGDNTHISRNVTIYTVSHNYSGNTLPYDDDENPKPVLIGKNVWIGMSVNIVPGITIGDGAIISMGTLVTQDIPERAIAGNAPNKIINYRDEKHYLNLEQKKSYGGVNGKPLSEDDKKGFGRNGTHTDQQILFVVTTGRSGSLTLAHMISQHPEITCLHEPRRQLIRLSTEYAHGYGYQNIKKRAPFDLL